MPMEEIVERLEMVLEIFDRRDGELIGDGISANLSTIMDEETLNNN